jgi:phage FluMu protein gp41
VNYIGTFPKKGMKVGSEAHKDFELRQMTTKDMLAAELEVSSAHPLNFSAQLATRQLVRVGTFTGPFVVSMVEGLDPVDFATLRNGLTEVSLLGED